MHARQLLARQHLKEAGIDGDRGMRRIAARCEGIRLRAVDQEDTRHRQPGAARQITRRVGRDSGARSVIDLARIDGRQRHAVGIPVGEKVCADGEDERDHHAAAPAEQRSDDQEQGGHRRQQNRGAHELHGANGFARRPGLSHVPL